ncbi:MAG: sensor histidine kinase [Ruminococcus sp.]|nr:sensor histidine kinase [Ruminococcus sp.]
MKQISISKIFLSYLKENIKLLSLLICFFIVYFVVFFLNKSETDIVLYGGILSFCVYIVYLILNFHSYYKKIRQLENVLLNIEYSAEHLPEIKNLSDKLYEEIIIKSFKNKTRLVSEFDKEINEMTNYYTMWTHQIKTPISASRLILENDDFKSKREIQNELFKIEQYVNSVLSYMRMNNESTDFLIKKYNLDNILKLSLKKFSSQFISKKLSLDYRETNLTVLTDEKWLSFVIEQILSNSVKYTNNGKISVYTEKENELIIEDTGIGISAEDLPRVFDNGFTGYNGRTDKKATGIGLFLCKGILTKLSHNIEIQSEINKGTKVIVKFADNNLTLND